MILCAKFVGLIVLTLGCIRSRVAVSWVCLVRSLGCLRSRVAGGVSAGGVSAGESPQGESPRGSLRRGVSALEPPAYIKDRLMCSASLVLFLSSDVDRHSDLVVEMMMFWNLMFL